jgi:hypothetical protein
MKNWLICVGLLLMTIHAAGAQSDCKSQAGYENHNMVDYGPLMLTSVIQGRAVDFDRVAVPGTCVFVYTENDHQLVTSTQVGGHGSFKLLLKHGVYRVVVKASPFCAANIPIHVVQLGHKTLVAHLKPAGIDSCSYGDYK